MSLAILLGLLVGVILLFVLFKAGSAFLTRFLLVPLQHWRDKINKALGHSKPVYLKVGHKRSSYRRRLILASKNPSFYTNFVNNKLKIYPGDYENDGRDLLEAMKKRDLQDPSRCKIQGFFHPYANNGGGGERVLWLAVKASLLQSDHNIAAIYTTNIESGPEEILDKAQQKFQVENLDRNRIVFVYLRRYGKLIDSEYWPRFTLIGQLVGSMVLALEALFELSPDTWIDTIGLPGSYLPVKWILLIPILTYLHYPIIQPDMFNKLKFRNFSLDQLKWFRCKRKDATELAKLTYWSGLFSFYKYLGSLVDITLTNGTWTYNHIQSIWSLNKARRATMEILYPPCGTEDLCQDAEPEGHRENKLLYIAQFRPEKRHSLVLRAYAEFLVSANKAKLGVKSMPTLVFLGSCRTPTDTDTLHQLQQETAELQLQDYVHFVIDCSYLEVLSWLSRVKFGLNAMWNEHFGIGVVEYMGRGVVPLCHASAGPYLDIVLGPATATSTATAPAQKDQVWRNEVGFFFKDSSDPDLDLSLQTDFCADYLSFPNPRNQSEIVTFPSLVQLLHELFITNPQLTDHTTLLSMRKMGAEIVLDKFSNHLFVSKWVNYNRQLNILETKYRETERSGIERYY